MISNRVQAFRIAHGIVRKGESLADMLKELTHGDFMPSLLPLYDAAVIAVKPESKISALMVESMRREDSQTASESPRKTRGKAHNARYLGSVSQHIAPMSESALNWLSDLHSKAIQNRRMPITIEPITIEES